MPIYINMFQHVLPGFVLGEQNVLPLFPGALRRSRYNRVMKPIAHIHSDLPQKFGIPRNSFLAPHLQASVIFEPEFALNSAVEGLDEFSHLWLIWQFENGTPGGTAADIERDNATDNKAGTNTNWTPILDIKPYIPFADCHADASGGWIEQVPWQELDVTFPPELTRHIDPDKLDGLVEVLRQDPRRAGSKHEPERVYHLAYADRDVAFTVDGTSLTVVDVL